MVDAESLRTQKAIEQALRLEQRSRFPLSRLMARLHRIRLLSYFLRTLILRLEGGEFFSMTLRDILREQYGVTVGKYSYGPCLKPGYLPRGTVVGNFCSISGEILVLRRNHPKNWLSQHPFFYNHKCGLLENDTIGIVEDNPLVVGHDAWIGARTIILPNCKSIGNGAIVGAGSIVTRDIAPFTIVAGNPARVIATRFPPAIETAVQESQWWLRPLPELLESLPVFAQSIPETNISILRALLVRR